jgi:hypothetical protein
MLGLASRGLGFGRAKADQPFDEVKNDGGPPVGDRSSGRVGVCLAPSRPKAITTQSGFRIGPGRSAVTDTSAREIPGRTPATRTNHRLCRDANLIR